MTTLIVVVISSIQNKIPVMQPTKINSQIDYHILNRFAWGVLFLKSPKIAGNHKLVLILMCSINNHVSLFLQSHNPVSSHITIRHTNLVFKGRVLRIAFGCLIEKNKT